MWACSKGRLDTALILYEWNHDALKVLNNKAQSALDCARAAQHAAIAEEIEKLEATREGAKVELPEKASSKKGSKEDGVFLRPGVVTRYASKINFRLLSKIKQEVSSPSFNQNNLRFFSSPSGARRRNTKR
jgi:hypothetical protein